MEGSIRKQTYGRLYDLGFADDYRKAWNLQKALVEQRINRRIEDSLILVEHDHVITLGRSSHIENVLAKDLPIFNIERGGDATYHGPGQLVAYPIISLEERGLGVKQYVSLLESVIIQALSKFGLTKLEGKFGLETGVWIDGKRKIASIGVSVSHWVTFHGFALNVNTDLSYFEKIRPCGFDASVMTSLSKEMRGKNVDFELVKRLIVESFSSLGFDFRFDNS